MVSPWCSGNPPVFNGGITFSPTARQRRRRAFQSGYENNGIKDNRTGEFVAFVDWTNDGSTPVHRYVATAFNAALEAEKSGEGQKPLRTTSEISLARDTVRVRTENESVTTGRLVRDQAELLKEKKRN